MSPGFARYTVTSCPARASRGSFQYATCMTGIRFGVKYHVVIHSGRSVRMRSCQESLFQPSLTLKSGSTVLNIGVGSRHLAAR